jgi:hypothetical protein
MNRFLNQGAAGARRSTKPAVGRLAGGTVARERIRHLERVVRVGIPYEGRAGAVFIRGVAALKALNGKGCRLWINGELTVP